MILARIPQPLPRWIPLRERMGWRVAGLLAVMLCLNLQSQVFAQDSPELRQTESTVNDRPDEKPASTAPTAKQPAGESSDSKSVVKELKPEVLLLPDRKGVLQPVPGFTLEDFIELYQRANRLNAADERPRYHLRSVEIDGDATPERAEFTANLQIECHEDGWIKVPLALDSAVLLNDPSYKGEGKFELQLDDDGSGYVLWLSGKAGEQHTLSMPLAAAVTTIGGESRLAFTFPRASRSEMALKVDGQINVVRAPDGVVLETDKSDRTTTRVKATGLIGASELAWRTIEAESTAPTTAFDVSGMVLARVDERTVSWDAKLTLRSYGAPLDRFRIRLPEGSDLLPAGQPGMNITPLAADPGSPSTKLVEVKLDKRSAGPVEVRLLAERQRDAAEESASTELAGFEVLGALRQRGNIAVQIAGNWQVMWGELRSARQIEDLPEELRRDNVTAGFHYFEQPYSLLARITPQRTRIAVEPEYLLLVGAQRTELQARLRYTVRGGKVRTFEIDMPGWNLGKVGPGSVVDVDGQIISADGQATISLLQPAAGEIELLVEAYRDTTTENGQLRLDLPAPQAESITPAAVAVVPADDVELSPVASAPSVLTSSTKRPGLPLPERQQEPLLLRAEKLPAQFVADMTLHEQRQTAELVTHVRMDDQDIFVEQRNVYDIAYVPLDRLTLQVPRSVSAESIKFSVEGQTISPLTLRDDDQSDSLSHISIPLPRPRIGRVELLVSYRLPQARLLPATSVTAAVPLVSPRGAKISRNTVHVEPTGNITVHPMKGAWSADSSSAGGERMGVTSFVSSDAQPSLGLAITLQEGKVDGSTVIERGWIQTWLTEQVRQDRAVFRFRSNQPEARLVLPAGVEANAVEAILNGKPATATPARDRELVIALDPAGGDEYVLDLRYQFGERGLPGSMRFEAPQWKPAVWVRRVYWQLVAPSSEHLLLTPGDQTSEFDWSWNGLFWDRRPTLEQPELEQWSGAEGVVVSPGVSNRYLFSTSGKQFALSVVTARRSMIVFVASFAILAVGLLLIYAPVVRHPLPLVIAGASLLVFSAIEPQTALVLAQASGFGIALVVVAFLIARKATRRRTVSEGLSVSSHGLKDRSATELYYRPVQSGSPNSTATAPMAVSSPEVPA